MSWTEAHANSRAGSPQAEIRFGDIRYLMSVLAHLQAKATDVKLCCPQEVKVTVALLFLLPQNRKKARLNEKCVPVFLRDFCSEWVSVALRTAWVMSVTVGLSCTVSLHVAHCTQCWLPLCSGTDMVRAGHSVDHCCLSCVGLLFWRLWLHFHLEPRRYSPFAPYPPSHSDQLQHNCSFCSQGMLHGLGTVFSPSAAPTSVLCPASVFVFALITMAA
jgi:hypothetical protein